MFGNVGIAFKGSGFYKNDSRGKSVRHRDEHRQGRRRRSQLDRQRQLDSKDAGSTTTSDGAASSTSTPTPKADTAKTSSTTT